MNSTDIIKKIIGVEKGYSNRKNDRGGKTKYGIIEKVARENGYMGDMVNLPYETAVNIYKKKYWDLNNLDQVLEISSLISFEVMDTGVNCGPRMGGNFLQISLNDLLEKGRLKVDSIIGSKTIEALKEFKEQEGFNGIKGLYFYLNCFQCSKYAEITLKDFTQRENFLGWVMKRVIENFTLPKKIVKDVRKDVFKTIVDIMGDSSIKEAQNILNLFNYDFSRKERIVEDIEITGEVDKQTLRAFESIFKKRGYNLIKSLFLVTLLLSTKKLFFKVKKEEFLCKLKYEANLYLNFDKDST